MKTKDVLIGVGVLASAVAAYTIYKKIKNKATVTSQIKAITTGTIKTLGINIPEIAAQIGIDLGYAYPVYDPRHWTENDEAVKTEVLKVPKPLIPTLIKEYYNRYKRNLQADLQSVLDDYSQISYLFT
jgi:hypothetical protein